MNTRNCRFHALVVGIIVLASLETTAQSNWIRKADMPTPRCSLAVAVLDGKIYAIGGGIRNQVVTTAVEQYDPATDTWVKKADMHTPRGFFGAAALNGKIYAVGGWGMGNVALAGCEEYDPASDTWTVKKSMPTARRHGSVVSAGGKIYALGGYTSPPTALKTLEVYDPATDSWTTTAPMPFGPGSGCTVIDRIIYCPLGGLTGGTGTDQAVNTVYAYDTDTGTCTAKSPMLNARCFSPTCNLNGKLYAIGGCINAYDNTETANVEAYDPAVNKWFRMPPMSVRRKALGAAVVNGKIYAIGGVSNAGWDPALATVEEYDPKPTVSLLRTGTALKIWWNGILEVSDTPDGTNWQALNPSTWPYSVLVTQAQTNSKKFYRALQP